MCANQFRVGEIDEWTIVEKWGDYEILIKWKDLQPEFTKIEIINGNLTIIKQY